MHESNRCGRAAPHLAGLALALASVIGRAADSDIIINEIMYHPPHDLEELQYVELFNRGESSVDLSAWAFTKGIRYVFPDATVLAPGGFLVVCRSRTAFGGRYGTNLTALGDFAGRLSHGGESLELCAGNGRVIEQITYSDIDPWPTGPDGYSASLERICPFVSGDAPANWAGSALPTVESPAGTPGRSNDSFSANLPPVVSKVAFDKPAPGQSVSVTAEISDGDSVQTATLLYRIGQTGGESAETEVPMRRIDGDKLKGTYTAAIKGQPEGTLVRFRLRAVDSSGALRFQPAPNEPRPTYSYSTFVNTNSARVPLAFAFYLSAPSGEREIRLDASRSIRAGPARGNGAFIYLPPGSDEVFTFDHVHLRPRGGGFKVHFQKDRLFKDMTGSNVIFEGPPRWVLSEFLAYELYRLAGVPAPFTEHLRVWLDGRPLGYQLLVEQPNKGFLTRNGRDNDGNLYKLLWYNQGIVGQHEKKTHPAQDHEDIVAVIQGLNAVSDAAQWEFIQKHFNVEEFINYFAVNMCIQNWDGFFNNYFAYHGTGRTGKWEIYPWDEDKTWGDYDGASAKYDWYEMPLTFGMRGDRAAQTSIWALFLGGGGGTAWWRPAGWFSGPMLANPEFRKRFLARLGEICNTHFTEEKFVPVIDQLEKRLEPEIAVRARITGQDATAALAGFRHDIQSFRAQVKHRRQFVLSELGEASGAP